MLIYTSNRMIVRHMPEFGGHEVFVDWQIQHEYSENMSKKSTVVRIIHDSNLLY